MASHEFRKRPRSTVIVMVLAAVEGVLALALFPGTPAQAATGWETHLVGYSSTLPQAEVEVATQDNTDPTTDAVVATWMRTTGSGEPGNGSELWKNYSLDGGSTWHTAAAVQPLPGGTTPPFSQADPSLAVDNSGSFLLGGLNKDNSANWSNTQPVLWTSTDGGASFRTAVTNTTATQVFNDRDWITYYNSPYNNPLYYVYSPRLPLNGNYTTCPTPLSRPIWFTQSTNGGSTWSSRVLVNPEPPQVAGEVGGDAARIGVATNGNIVVGELAVGCGDPGDVFTGDGYADISTDGGTSWASRIMFNNASTRMAIATTDPKATYGTIKVSGNTVYAIWVGVNGSTNWSVYVSSLDLTKTPLVFSTPVAIVTVPGAVNAPSLTLPSLANDVNGNLHATWLRQSAGKWGLYYSTSSNLGGNWSTPSKISYPISDWSITSWTGDFNRTYTNNHDLFVAWSLNDITVSPNKHNVYVSIKRAIT
jgi:hypothetical protein